MILTGPERWVARSFVVHRDADSPVPIELGRFGQQLVARCEQRSTQMPILLELKLPKFEVRGE